MYVKIIYAEYIADNVAICPFMVTGSVCSCTQTKSRRILTVTVTYVRYRFIEYYHTYVLS